MTVMFSGRVLTCLKRLSSSSAAPSPALGPLGAVSRPHASSDVASGAKKDEMVHGALNPYDSNNYVIKKKATRPRVAMLLSFHGSNYYGMQFNVHGPAIENILFDAFLKIGILPKDSNRNASYYLEYERASRTDRGVSALRQVISFRKPRDLNIDGINEFLPHDIRVLGMKRVDMVFDAKNWCNARTYSYIMPTYALCNYRHILNPCRNYRIDSDTILKASQIFQMFRGSHNFHNYTEKIDLWDKRSLRKIMDTQISNPFLMGDIEMIEFKIKGQSFMLHQIRRMIGMVISIMCGKAQFHMLKETLEHPMMPAPTAPALGLLLEKQHFDGYNKRYPDTNPLEWVECDDQVDKFKLQVIVPHMVNVEREENHMETFLNEKLKRHSFRSNSFSNKLVRVGKWDNSDALEKLLQSEEK